MANIFTDGFSTYTTPAQIDQKWQGGRTGGGVVTVGSAFAIGSAPQGLQCNVGGPNLLFAAYNHYFFGMRTKFISGATYTDFWAWFDTATQQCGLMRNSSGTLSARRNGTNLVTSSLTVAEGVTYYLEVELKIDNSVGIFKVWVDGVLYCNFSGDTQATANAFINKWQPSGGGGGGHVIYHADCYVNDDTGTVCNGRLGDVQITARKVASAGTFAQFGRGGVDTGTNAGQLNKDFADPASVTVDNVLNHRDSFTMAALGTGTILGARLWANAKKDSLGPRSLALTVESGGTDSIGADQNIGGAAFLWYGRDMSLDPNTAALWANLAALNAAKCGYKITV